MKETRRRYLGCRDGILMSEQINPYKLFLDLDTAPKKPSYYELLGVSQDERDDTVVARGCEKALAKVRGFKPGANAQIWLAILDEISNARVTLTDVELRRAYDQQLAAGAQPEALELIVLNGPVDAVASANLASAGMPEESPRSSQSLADQLVPSHLGSGNPPPIPSAEAIVDQATTPVFASPQVPVAAEVPMTVGTVQSVDPGVASAPGPVGQESGFSLESGRRSRNSRRHSKRRAKQNRFPLPLLVMSVFAIIGGVIAIFALNVGNTEVANVDKTAKPKGVQKTPDRIKIKPEDRPGAETDPERKEPEMPEPVPRDPGTGENPLNPLPPVFGKPVKPEEPKPVENVPQKPEEPVVKPPVDPPAAEPLTATEKTKLKESLSIARTALAERNLDIVIEQLAIATPLARTKDAAAATRRLKIMLELVTQFNRLSNEAMDSYKSGSEINVGTSTKAVVVEVSPTELTIKAAGVTRSYPRDRLSAGVAMGIAQTNFNDPVMTPFMKAAYLVTLKGDRYQKQAREFWQSGNSRSAKIDADTFDGFVADRYEFE